MRTDFIERNRIASLATGMFDDTHQLVQQQIALVKAEVRIEVAKLKTATLALAMGMAVVFLGCVLIPFLLADLLLNLTQGELPVWGAYSVVSLSLIGVGLILFSSANKKFKEVADIPKNKIESLKKEFHAARRSF